MKRLFAGLCCLLILVCLAPGLAEAWDPEVTILAPVTIEGEAVSAPVPLNLGPTGQFPAAEASLTPGAAFCFFGQADCWAMVGTGTADAPGTIGWIQAGALSLPEEPELLFEDAVPVDLPEDTFLTANPLDPEPARLAGLPAGARVTLLAVLGDWGYVQSEADGEPLRAFLPMEAIR